MSPCRPLLGCERDTDRNRGAMRTLSGAVLGLLLVNIAVFAAGILLPSAHEQILVHGALWFPTHENFAVWQVVSYLFLHGNFSHIFFNMFALVSFGSILEAEWGATRF